MPTPTSFTHEENKTPSHYLWTGMCPTIESKMAQYFYCLSGFACPVKGSQCRIDPKAYSDVFIFLSLQLHCQSFPNTYLYIFFSFTWEFLKFHGHSERNRTQKSAEGLKAHMELSDLSSSVHYMLCTYYFWYHSNIFTGKVSIIPHS